MRVRRPSQAFRVMKHCLTSVRDPFGGMHPPNQLHGGTADREKLPRRLVYVLAGWLVQTPLFCRTLK